GKLLSSRQKRFAGPFSMRRGIPPPGHNESRADSGLASAASWVCAVCRVYSDFESALSTKRLRRERRYHAAGKQQNCRKSDRVNHPDSQPPVTDHRFLHRSCELSRPFRPADRRGHPETHGRIASIPVISQKSTSVGYSSSPYPKHAYSLVQD